MEMIICNNKKGRWPVCKCWVCNGNFIVNNYKERKRPDKTSGIHVNKSVQKILEFVLSLVVLCWIGSKYVLRDGSANFEHLLVAEMTSSICFILILLLIQGLISFKLLIHNVLLFFTTLGVAKLCPSIFFYRSENSVTTILVMTGLVLSLWLIYILIIEITKKSIFKNILVLVTIVPLLWMLTAYSSALFAYDYKKPSGNMIKSDITISAKSHILSKYYNSKGGRKVKFLPNIAVEYSCSDNSAKEMMFGSVRLGQVSTESELKSFNELYEFLGPEGDRFFAACKDEESCVVLKSPKGELCNTNEVNEKPVQVETGVSN